MRIYVEAIGARSEQPARGAAECRIRVRLSRKWPAVRPVLDDVGMAQNFLACNREQSFLMPPDVREWLPENHLAWFVIDAVGVMDTTVLWGISRGRARSGGV